MKPIHLFLFLASCVLLLPTVFSQYIPPLADPRDDLKHPSSLQSIKRIYFSNYFQPLNTSEIEDDPSSFSLHSPLNGSEEDLLSSRIIKKNSPDAYNMQGVNLSTPLTDFKTDPRTKGIVLVRNTSALRLLPGYNGLLEEEEASEPPKHLPKYSKDPLPYYSPIHNGSEIITEREKENLFAVPIEFADERSPFDPDNENLHELRKARLARSSPGTYYDPTYWPFYRRPDGINKTLLEAAYRKTKPKVMRLQDFMRGKYAEEKEKQLILGRLNLTDEYRIDKRKNWELMRENEDDLFQAWYNNTLGLSPSYQIKKNDPQSYTLKFKETGSKIKKGRLHKSGLKKKHLRQNRKN